MTKKISATLLLTLGFIGLHCVNSTARADEEGTSEVISTNKNFKITFGGRLHLDAAQSDQSGTNVQSYNIRRARLDARAKIGTKTTVRLEHEFSNSPGWRNVFVAYRANDHLEYKLGNFVAPFSMEDMQSTNAIPFSERSLSNGFALGFGKGGQVAYVNKNSTLRLGYFTPPLGKDDERAPTRGKGFTGRVTYAPMNNRKQTLHFGLGLDERRFDSTDRIKLSAISGSSFNGSLIDTPSLTSVKSRSSYNAEFAYVSKSVMVQGQYLATNIQRDAAEDVNFSGYYIQAGWVVTGQNYSYNSRSGLPDEPDMRKKLGVELVGRYSQISLNSGLIRGGQAQTTDLGAVVHFNEHVKLLGTLSGNTIKAAQPSVPSQSTAFTMRLITQF